jgi:6-phosphogluconolactonase (cycloisomerase 2 family)
VTVDPSGKYVYAANSGSANVSAYEITNTGGLEEISGSPFSAGQLPVSVAVDPSGKFAYVVNKSGGTVSGYTIGGDGALSPVVGSPFPAGSSPSWLTIVEVISKPDTGTVTVPPGKAVVSSR